MKVMAHRGFSGVYPENTMSAFINAEGKADAIELDVQLSKDAQVVVIHDETIDRVTDGTGFVRDYTLSELQKFNAAEIKKEFSDCPVEVEKIPSFEEYCSWVCKTNLETNIELKTGVFYYDGIVQKTVEIVKKYGLEERVMFSSFNHLSLIQAKKIAPEIPCGILVPERGFGNAGIYCRQFGFEYFHPCYKSLTAEDVELCRKNGIKINVWTVDDMAGLEKISRLNVDGIISDFPEFCRL